MIKKLRLKLIAVTMGVLLVVFVIIFVMLNIFMQTQSVQRTDDLLQRLAAEETFVPFPPERNNLFRPQPGMHPPDAMRATPFFTVKVDHNGNILDTYTRMMFDFSQEDAQTYASQALSSNAAKGSIDHLQYLIAPKSYGKIVVFAERSIETQMLQQLMQLSFWIALGTAVVLFVVVFFLSRWMVQPVSIAFAKQRRFISDASHELKTPLTILSANADVLENEIGENPRLLSIKSQSRRMGDLIHDLLTLARADEQGQRIAMNEFDLSKTIRNTTLEFESTAFENGKQLEYDIADNLLYTGNEQQIKQVTTILIDNAIRHSNQNGEIKVRLLREGNKIHLSVFNTGVGIKESEREKVFDRFYRTDVSRSRETGGYGLGLAIAKSIVEAHRGKISVSGTEGRDVCFTVSLPA